jgi:hypothetical protein
VLDHGDHSQWKVYSKELLQAPARYRLWKTLVTIL